MTEALHGGLVLGGTGRQRRHDVAVARGLLLMDHHDVAVQDGGVDHGVAHDAKGEVLAAAARVGRRDAEVLLDLLGGQDRGAGRDPSDQGHRRSPSLAARRS